MFKFATQLPHHPSLLNVLVVHHCSSNGRAFRDFNVCCNKITYALYWLKANNCYYVEIFINNEVLESLPDDGYIDNQLRHIQDDQNLSIENDVVTSTFVPYLLPADSKDVAIKNTIDHMQSKDLSII